MSGFSRQICRQLFRALIFLLTGALQVTAASAQQEQEVRLKNPLSKAVLREPLVIPVKEPGVTLVDSATGKSVLTQVDEQVSGQYELVTLVDLDSQSQRVFRLAPTTNPSSEPERLKMEMQGQDRCIVTTEDFTFQVELIRDPRKDFDGLLRVQLTDFKASDTHRPAPAIQLIRNISSVLFHGPPQFIIRSGPVRAQLIIQGQGQLRQGSSAIVLGEHRLVLTVYQGVSGLEIEDFFTPESPAQVGVGSAGTFVLRTQNNQQWKVYTPRYPKNDQPNPPTPWHEVVFGSEKELKDQIGKDWVYATSDKQGMVIVHDARSTMAQKLGEGGSGRSEVRYRLSNFDVRSNYIRPDFYHITGQPDEVLSMRQRVRFFDHPLNDTSQVEHEHQVWQTTFLVQRLAEPFRFEGPVAILPEDAQSLQSLLREKDVAILAGNAMSPANLKALEQLAKQWQVPLLRAGGLFTTFLNTHYSRNDTRDLVLILVGSPDENIIVHDNASRHALVDSYFPGKGKGRISLIDNFLGHGRQAIYAGGFDEAGTAAAIEYLKTSFSPPAMQGLQIRTMPMELRARPWMTRSQPVQPIELAAVRNETEIAHVLLHAPQDITRFRATANLRGPGGEVIEGKLHYIPWSIPAVALDGRLVTEGYQSIHPLGSPLPQSTPHPGSTAEEGEWLPFQSPDMNHDALWPGVLETLPAGRLVSLWVVYEIPASARAGAYAGQIELSWQGGKHTIPVKLDVADITLPEAWAMDYMPLYDLYSYHATANMLSLYLGVEKDSDDYWQVIEKFGRMLQGAGVTVAQLSRFDITLDLQTPGQAKIDASKASRTVQAYRDGGYTGRFIMSFPPSYWRKMQADAAKHTGMNEEQARTWFISSIEAWIDSQNLGKLIIRVADEPGDLAQWASWAQEIRSPKLLTTVCHNKTDLESMSKIVGHIDIWCPLWNKAITSWNGRLVAHDSPAIFSQAFFDQRRKAGDTIWNYTCATPYMSLTRLPTEMRFYLWDSYAKGFDGAVYYGGGYWSHMWGRFTLPGVRGHTQHRNEFAYNVYARTGWPGGTSIMYPDATRKEIIASQRWELLRQGQEDVKLFKLFKDKFGEDALREILSPVVAPQPHSDVKPEVLTQTRLKVIQKLAGQ